ncbi:MAG: hypothetical protein K2X38_07960 [Gemmataceae bacterium]|nr:hypothetical protein [Gemmataceae bacterium]
MGTKVIRSVMSNFERDRRQREFLLAVQKKHMPQDADMAVAINLDNGEFLLGDRWPKLLHEFDERWPGAPHYLVRVDGRPVVRLS